MIKTQKYAPVSPFDFKALEAVSNSLKQYRPSALTDRQVQVDKSEATQQYEQYVELSKFDIDKKTFDGNVKNYFMESSNKIYELKNQIDSQQLDPILGAQMIMELEKELSQYGRVKSMLATDALYFKQLGASGSNNLSKLNDPDMRMLFGGIWKDDGTVGIEKIDGTLALVGKGPDWNYSLSLSEYEILRSKKDTVVQQVTKPSDIGAQVLGESFVEGGSWIVKPNKENKDIKYYDMDKLNEYLKSPLTNQGVSTLLRNPGFASVWADYMPTLTENGMITGGGMRDIQIDDPRFEHWDVTNEDMYKRAENFMINELTLSNIDPKFFVKRDENGEYQPVNPDSSDWDTDNTIFNQKDSSKLNTNDPDYINMGALFEIYGDTPDKGLYNKPHELDKLASTVNNVNPLAYEQKIYSFDQYANFLANNPQRGIDSEQWVKEHSGGGVRTDLRNRLLIDKTGDGEVDVLDSRVSNNVFALLDYMGDSITDNNPAQKVFRTQIQSYIDAYVKKQTELLDFSLKTNTITQPEYDRKMKEIMNQVAGN